MKFCSENAGDIDKYFRHTFMKFPGFAGDTLHRIDSVDESRVRGMFLDDEGSEAEFQFELHPSYKQTPPDVDFLFPQKAWFQMGEHALFLHRLPARQYRKGICSENTAIYRLVQKDYGPLEGYALQFDSLKAYVEKPAYRSLSTLDHTSGISWALSRRMAVNCEGSLYVDTLEVGQVDWAAKKVKVKETIFREEILAICGEEFYLAVPRAPRKTGSKLTSKYAKDKDGKVFRIEDEEYV